MTSPGLDIIIGPMYSSKTTELLRRLFTVSEVNLNSLYINNSIDNRNQLDVFSSHNPQLKSTLSNNKVKMISVKNLSDVEDSLLNSSDIIGVDEAQFFDDLMIIKDWVDKKNKRVVIAGLDGDFNRNTFGKIHQLLPHCDSIVKLTAFCTECAKKQKLSQALFTYKKSSSYDVIEVGGNDKYSALCRMCYNCFAN